MNEEIFVSVIIPTYNRAKLLDEAIKSVLEQTYKNFEIIVVDDCSTDNTEEIVKKIKDTRIRYIRHEENHGGSAARNTGIKAAKGDYIAFHDSDDLWLPQKLEKQVDILINHKDIALVYTNIIYIDNNGKYLKVGFEPTKFVSGYAFKECLLADTPCLLATWLIRKSCFDTLGYFDEDFQMAQGREMELKIARIYKIYGIKEPLYLNRIHALPRTSGKSAELSEYYWFKFLNKTFRESGSLVDERTKRKVISHYYFLVGIRYFKEMNLTKARLKMRNSIIHYPFKLKVYKYFIATFISVRCLMIIKKYKIKRKYK
ncbi:MAG: glycosyltransferase family 2 protein [bacterium]